MSDMTDPAAAAALATAPVAQDVYATLAPHATRHAAIIFAAACTMHAAAYKRANTMVKPVGTTPAHVAEWDAGKAVHAHADRYGAGGVMPALLERLAANELNKAPALPPPPKPVAEGRYSSLIREHLVGENLPHHDNLARCATVWLDHTTVQEGEGGVKTEVSARFRVFVFDTADSPAQFGLTPQQVRPLGPFTVMTDGRPEVLDALAGALSVPLKAGRPKGTTAATGAKKRQSKADLELQAAKQYHDTTHAILRSYMIQLLKGEPVAVVAATLQRDYPQAFAALVAEAQAGA